MRYHDITARSAGYCDWCKRRIEVGEPISQIVVGDDDLVQAGRGDTRWFHHRCARQVDADAFW
jgi:hypothetical protein